jgi:hypothetical protein
MNPSGKPDAGNLPVRFEEGARCQRVAAPPLLHLAFLIPYVAWRAIWGNAKTRAVREIGSTIAAGDSRESAMNKIEKMRNYDPVITIRPSLDAKTVTIRVLSCPGYDHYYETFIIDGDVVTQGSYISRKRASSGAPVP